MRQKGRQDRGRSIQKAMGIYTGVYFTEIPYPQLNRSTETHRASYMKRGKNQLRKRAAAFQKLDKILRSQGLFSA